MSEYKKIENAKAEVTCTLEGESWKNAIEKAFKKNASEIEVKGFRKGQAPRNIVEKYINNNKVLLDAAENLAQGTLDEAIKEHNIELIDRPSLRLDSIDDDKCVMTFELPVMPDVKLGDYKKLEYKVDEVKVDDKEVDDQIADLLDRKADLEIKEDGEVENGDTTVIDFEGFLDGVPFDGGKGENYDLVIGSGSFIPGFEEQLIGMKPEETKEIKVTFPEDYQAENLKGKETTFNVTVHEIKKKVLPLLDDEFVKELKMDGINTVDELKEDTKKKLSEKKENEAKNKADNDLMDKLAEMTEVEIPEVMINSELDTMVQSYEQRLMQQGLALQQFLSITGQTIDSMKESMKDDAIKRIKINLGLSNIAKNEKLEVSAEDIENEYKKIAEQYGMEAEEIKSLIPDSSLTDDLLLNKALELLKK